MPTPPKPPESSPTAPTAPTAPPPRHQLLTRAQALAALRRERDEHGLSETARKYDLSPQQLWNALNSGKISNGMLEKCRYRIWELLEKIEPMQTNLTKEDR